MKRIGDAQSRLEACGRCLLATACGSDASGELSAEKMHAIAYRIVRRPTGYSLSGSKQSWASAWQGVATPLTRR